MYTEEQKMRRAAYIKVWRAQNYERCRTKDRERKALNRAANPQKYQQISQKSHLLRRYGISTEDYNKMLLGQGGVCKICKQPETTRINGVVCRLAVDHGPDGEIRGLLCGRCNRGIGYFQHDPLRLNLAIKYLEEFYRAA